MPDERVTRLRDLIARLERSPATPKREWMLAETRRRLSDLQTGDATEPMRPYDDGGEDPRAGEPSVRPAPPLRVVAPEPPPRPAAPPPPRPPPPPPRSETRDEKPLAEDEILWLDDDEDDDPPSDSPWKRGLRG